MSLSVNTTPRTVIVVVPTFNERENVELLLPHLLRLDLEGWRLSVCVVDDNSPDGTGSWSKRFLEAHSGSSVLIRTNERGLGSAYIAGMKHALMSHAHAIITMDADYSHHPRYIAHLLACLEIADVSIGSRYVPGGSVHYPLGRRALSRAANFAAHTMVGLKASDATAGFRAYKREVLQSIDFNSIRSNGYSFLMEMLFLVQSGGWTVTETPIEFADRRYGVSKIAPREVGRAARTCLRILGHRLSLGRAPRTGPSAPDSHAPPR